MKSTIQHVKDFHDANGIETPLEPSIDNDDLNELRIELIKEELEELETALALRDPVAVLDALTDIQYVLDGAYLSLGFSEYKEEAFEEVQRSNMSKLGPDGKPIRREDGKILKGPNYFPPDLESIINGD